MLLIFAGHDGSALALSGRGGGYQNSHLFKPAGIEARLSRLDELLTLSAAQKVQVKAVLRRSNNRNAAPRIRALLTDRQREIYEHTPRPVQE